MTMTQKDRTLQDLNIGGRVMFLRFLSEKSLKREMRMG
jgi:hypothetical protein